MKYGMKPIGTFPHEWVMFHGAIFGYKRANFLSLEDWIDVYQGDLGTALVDTYTTDSFLDTLTKKQAYLLSGFRQDSGDEIEVGNNIIDKIESFGIDPKSKLIVFSNALNFEKAKHINETFQSRCKVSFGIGTNLTNDTGVSWSPANIVMKLMKCRLDETSPWENCIKISDNTGKHMGDENEIAIAKQQLKLNF
jgi:nicotinate phosphoribosyltransferase